MLTFSTMLRRTLAPKDWLLLPGATVTEGARSSLSSVGTKNGSHPLGKTGRAPESVDVSVEEKETDYYSSLMKSIGKAVRKCGRVPMWRAPSFLSPSVLLPVFSEKCQKHCVPFHSVAPPHCHHHSCPYQDLSHFSVHLCNLRILLKCRF